MSLVWVTGANGFIGKNLSVYLASQGNKVMGVGHGFIPPELISNYGLSYWIDGEIDSANLHQLSNIEGYPEVIYHMAGGSSVGLSLAHPAEDFKKSTLSTLELLEWIRTYSPQTKMVLPSSAAVYGNAHGNVPIKEDNLIVPCSPYGFHKRSVEWLCQSYSYNFGVQLTIVRLFSVYGKGLRKQFLWDICCKLKHSPSILHMHGTGEEIRDWLYIGDAVAALTLAASKASDKFFILNGGTGIGTSTREIAQIVSSAWDQSPELQFSGKNRAGDPKTLVADIKLLQQIGFQPNELLQKGLEKYVAWFKNSEYSKIND